MRSLFSDGFNSDWLGEMGPDWGLSCKGQGDLRPNRRVHAQSMRNAGLSRNALHHAVPFAGR